MRRMNREQQLAAWGGQDWFRLELMMDYSDPFNRNGSGSAACRWSILADISDFSLDSHPGWTRLQAILIGHLYARVLSLVEVSHRAELFRRVHAAVTTIMRTKDLSSIKFEPWDDHRRMFFLWPVTHPIWPWTYAPWSQIERRKPIIKTAGKALNPIQTYTATMMIGPSTDASPEGWWMRLDFEAAFNRVLLPAAPLLAATLYWDEADEENRSFLVPLLRALHGHYETPERVQLGDDSFAVTAAMTRLREEILPRRVR
jgi:hypothetical protein